MAEALVTITLDTPFTDTPLVAGDLSFDGTFQKKKYFFSISQKCIFNPFSFKEWDFIKRRENEM